jgi:shikimate dehydrogenase
VSAPTGATRVAAVIGDPIRHSRSPRILNAAFAAAGLDWVYVAFPVAEGQAPGALAAMRTFGISGLSVTMPHKTAVADHLDAQPWGELSDTARRLRAVNCVVPDGDRLVGHNTDGAGFVASLGADAGFSPQGARCVVLGAGGAARALILALAGAGAAEVVVVNRSPDRAAEAAALAGPVGRVGAFGGSDVLAGADLVVNATSVGMDGRSCPVDPEGLGATMLVADIVMQPPDTPLLQAAAASGAATLAGLGMLARQAAVAFELWTGQDAPVEVMVRAAEAH